VAVPNKAILKIIPFTQLNKEAYLKGHSRKGEGAAHKELEMRLFENMFEIVLDQEYEKIFRFREIDAVNSKNEYGGSSSQLRISSQGLATKPGSSYATLKETKDLY
jgi:hypothetical protein